MAAGPARAHLSRLQLSNFRNYALLSLDLAPGAIILVHEGAGHGRSVEAIALLLERLRERGYRCVLPEDL